MASDFEGTLKSLKTKVLFCYDHLCCCTLCNELGPMEWSYICIMCINLFQKMFYLRLGSFVSRQRESWIIVMAPTSLDSSPHPAPLHSSSGVAVSAVQSLKAAEAQPLLPLGLSSANRPQSWPAPSSVKAPHTSSLNGVNDVRAPLEPRASLVVRAPLAHGVLQDGRAGLSENAISGIFWPSKMRVLPHWPPHC